MFVDARNRELFTSMRSDRRIQIIARELEKGGPGAYKIMEESTIQENSAGLQYFLLFLKKPLVPSHIQALALGKSRSILI